jgi:hypothetical protein
VVSIEVMPQVPKGMWPENMRKSFFYLTLNGLMLQSFKDNWNHHNLEKKNQLKNCISIGTKYFALLLFKSGI